MFSIVFRVVCALVVFAVWVTAGTYPLNLWPRIRLPAPGNATTSIRTHQMDNATLIVVQMAIALANHTQSHPTTLPRNSSADPAGKCSSFNIATPHHTNDTEARSSGNATTLYNTTGSDENVGRAGHKWHFMKKSWGVRVGNFSGNNTRKGHGVAKGLNFTTTPLMIAFVNMTIVPHNMTVTSETNATLSNMTSVAQVKDISKLVKEDFSAQRFALTLLLGIMFSGVFLLGVTKYIKSVLKDLKAKRQMSFQLHENEEDKGEGDMNEGPERY